MRSRVSHFGAGLLSFSVFLVRQRSAREFETYRDYTLWYLVRFTILMNLTPQFPKYNRANLSASQR
jgi:beta-lactamase regulating signal transducer with metallopeptidase domain